MSDDNFDPFSFDPAKRKRAPNPNPPEGSPAWDRWRTDTLDALDWRVQEVEVPTYGDIAERNDRARVELEAALVTANITTGVAIARVIAILKGEA